MADATHAHTDHILPLRLYFGVFGALLVLTAVTVYIAGFQFGAFNLVVAMAVAAVKASLVALFFMHLKYDNKVYLTIFITSIAFLAIFITFTMADTLTRGNVDPIKSSPINPKAVIYRNEDRQTGPPDTTNLQDTAAAAGDTGAADTITADMTPGSAAPGADTPPRGADRP